MDKRQTNSSQIIEIDRRIAELDFELEKLQKRKSQLLEQFPPVQTTQPEHTTEQKISIFRNLFKGRSDVFATRWENKQKRSGYSVACNNEWVKGLCNKPRIKCNECVNQDYTPLGQQTYYDHLSGKKVVGLYPLLLDNSCYLLAADFDKEGWEDAVKAMSEACTSFDIPHTIEISRSGNGAHLWIFFSEPVQAGEARLLGFSLLDKAMESYPSLSFDSYDRLFPNQDIMPEGGFGNLIALPLQKEARAAGNSCFVDHKLDPLPDQWSHLSRLKTVSKQGLSELISQLSSNPLQLEEQGVIDTRPPWEQTAKQQPFLIDNPPEQIKVTLANRIYIRLSEIPAPLLVGLRRLASFSNPIFFKTQALRFSTHGIPRFITCATIEQGFLTLPRGCLDEARALLNEQKISVNIDDKRQQGTKLKKFNLLVTLRKNQQLAVNAMLKHDTGVLHAPTAFGKTVSAIGMIAKRKTNTLILTHSRQLLTQWRERLGAFLPDLEVGIIGGGKRKPTGQIDVATYQSLINKKDNTVDMIVQDYGQVIVDECHHISAPRFEMVINEVRAKFVLGLTATPIRQDGHQKIIFMTAGPIRHKAKSTQTDSFEKEVIVTQIPDPPPEEMIKTKERPKISDAYRWIMENEERTQRIVNDVLNSVAQSRNPLVLTERREHAEQINKLLIDSGIESIVLKGAMSSTERKKANDNLSSAKVVVATGKYVGEGFDLPRLDTLFLAMPIAWKGSLAQYAGRIHREVENKHKVMIYDYVDISLPMLDRMFNKREKSYKALGYSLKFNSRANSTIS